jgi:hypothetical protein
MTGDLQSTITNNINNLRAQVKSARPDPSDPQYAVKMQRYEELLKTMVPVIQRLQSLSVEILNELRGLIDRLWKDVCENNGRGIDRLLEEHAQMMVSRLQQTFFGPFSELEEQLRQINSIH